MLICKIWCNWPLVVSHFFVCHIENAFMSWWRSVQGKHCFIGWENTAFRNRDCFLYYVPLPSLGRVIRTKKLLIVSLVLPAEFTWGLLSKSSISTCQQSETACFYWLQLCWELLKSIFFFGGKLRCCHCRIQCLQGSQSSRLIQTQNVGERRVQLEPRIKVTLSFGRILCFFSNYHNVSSFLEELFMDRNGVFVVM